MNQTKSSLMAALLLVSVLAAGCGDTRAPEAAAPSPVPAAAPTDQPAPSVPAPAVQEAKMDEKTVVKLAAAGIRAYWHVMSGGEGAGGSSAGGAIPTFQKDGREYRYLGTDIGTREKLMAFLQHSYTAEASEAFIAAAGIVEHEGRLAQPNADGGSLLQWENAQASLINETADGKQYELKVPYGEGADLQFKPVRVEVKRVSGAWRIHTPAHQLK